MFKCVIHSNKALGWGNNPIHVFRSWQPCDTKNNAELLILTSHARYSTNYSQQCAEYTRVQMVRDTYRTISKEQWRNQGDGGGPPTKPRPGLGKGLRPNLLLTTDFHRRKPPGSRLVPCGEVEKQSFWIPPPSPPYYGLTGERPLLTWKSWVYIYATAGKCKINQKTEKISKMSSCCFVD